MVYFTMTNIAEQVYNSLRGLEVGSRLVCFSQNADVSLCGSFNGCMCILSDLFSKPASVQPVKIEAAEAPPNPLDLGGGQRNEVWVGVHERNPTAVWNELNGVSGCNNACRMRFPVFPPGHLWVQL